MFTTSPTLITKLRNLQDREAWGLFVEIYTPLLYHWARRRFGASEADADELVHSVMAILAGRMPTFEYESGKSFRAWLCTIMQREWWRIQKKYVPNADSAQLDSLDASDHAPKFADEEFAQMIMQRALDLLRREFNEEVWQCFWQMAIEDKSAETVGKELAMPPGRVRVHKFRVLKRLRDEFGDMLE